MLSSFCFTTSLPRRSSYKTAPELESGSKGESIGRRFYAVRESTPGPLCLALHAALALSALETVDSDSDHAHFSWSTPELKSHWSPAAVRPRSASPRTLIADSNCRSQGRGAGLSLGPHAPPVALKLENKAPAEGIERPLQGRGSLGRSVWAPARSLRPPGRTCSAALGRHTAALTSGARGHCRRVNPLYAARRLLPAAAPPPSVKDPIRDTRRGWSTVPAARSPHLVPPYPPGVSPSTRRGHSSCPPRCGSPNCVASRSHVAHSRWAAR